MSFSSGDSTPCQKTIGNRDPTRFTSTGCDSVADPCRPRFDAPPAADVDPTARTVARAAVLAMLEQEPVRRIHVGKQFAGDATAGAMTSSGPMADESAGGVPAR